MPTTIAAIASPPGGARRGILRLSGPDAARLVRATLRAGDPPFDAETRRQSIAGRFDDGRGLQPVRLLWMRAPHSYTREDVAEFHLVGAEPLLCAALARLLALGAVAARPGEFTRRAFQNGRLDLSQAEGVLALVTAENEAERAAAARLYEGGLSARVAGIREALLELLALCEASLDFEESETGHVPREELLARWHAAAAGLEAARAFEERRAGPSAWPRVHLVGAPNAGKSSLWNVLTGGRALVSDLAGTTRDVLVGRWELPGFVCLLCDAPGLEAAEGGPRARAQALSERARQGAELELWVREGTEPACGPTPPPGALIAWSKRDLARPIPPTLDPTWVVVPVSTRTGEGLALLAQAVVQRLGQAGGAEGAPALVLEARQRQVLEAAATALEAARRAFEADAPLDLVAEGLRAALHALDELTGRTAPDEVLDRLFARFCLGK